MMKPTDVIVEYLYRQADGEFWLDILVDRQPYGQFGPFATEAERDRVREDMVSMMHSAGASDLPLRMQ